MQTQTQERRGESDWLAAGGEYGFSVMSIGVDYLPSTNFGDQRAAGVDLDLTKKRTTAAPLHPMVRRLFAVQITAPNTSLELSVVEEVDGANTRIPIQAGVQGRFFVA